jgi:hypothetical protein
MGWGILHSQNVLKMDDKVIKVNNHLATHG